MKNKTQKGIYQITVSAVVAALYVVLTWLSAVFGLSSGAIQLRISEALCVLPAFSPSAVWGLGIGCLISNVLFSGNPLDIVFGTLATLIGALGAYLLRRHKWLVTLPTLVANTVIVPFVIYFGFGATELALPFLFLTVGAGELLSATVLGTILLFALQKRRFKIE